MFSEVNSLLFLLIFLVCMALCLMVYHRIVLCPGNESWPEGIKKLFLCGLAALLLTVAAIYLWYLVVLLMAVAVKYLWCRCASARIKWIITAGIIAFTVLVAVAGIQLMVSRNADEEEDAVIEEMTENGMASVPLGEQIVTIYRF